MDCTAKCARARTARAAGRARARQKKKHTKKKKTKPQPPRDTPPSKRTQLRPFGDPDGVTAKGRILYCVRVGAVRAVAAGGSHRSARVGADPKPPRRPPRRARVPRDLRTRTRRGASRTLRTLPGPWRRAGGSRGAPRGARRVGRPARSSPTPWRRKSRIAE